MYFILVIVSVLLATSSSLPIKNDGLSSGFIQDEDRTLKQLTNEAQGTGGSFEGVWDRSESANFEQYGIKKKNLLEKYRQKEILNLAEIRILICYCYDQPPFYQDLNKDLRDNGGNRYRVATNVLKGAITKLMKHQPSLPRILYRAEPNSLFNVYENLLKKSENGVLPQFTSTSRSSTAAEIFRRADPGAKMVIKFENPQLGADVDDFSNFDEKEFLLPVSAVYTVKRATKNGENYDVVLSGYRKPTSGSGHSTSGNIKHTSNVFIIFVSVLIIKLV